MGVGKQYSSVNVFWTLPSFPFNSKPDHRGPLAPSHGEGRRSIHRNQLLDEAVLSSPCADRAVSLLLFLGLLATPPRPSPVSHPHPVQGSLQFHLPLAAGWLRWAPPCPVSPAPLDQDTPAGPAPLCPHVGCIYLLPQA